MSTVLKKRIVRTVTITGADGRKTKILRGLPHKPNYICILPPGRVLAEKIFEMGIDAEELAKRMRVAVSTVKKLLKYEIPLTEPLAKKIEKVTWMNAEHLLTLENSYHRNLEYAMQHPEIPAFLGEEIINQPKKGYR
ncbi:hypothetical protein FACS189443_1120 [Planctomycetales bacterium]|nr:hypothetical protein FACS189443_1120 [Planctomycetales bacterium]